MGCFCNECSYFNGKGICLFQKKPTRPDVKCWAKMYEIVDNELIEHFHYGQGLAMSSDKRIVLIAAGKQSGKTSFGPLWTHHQMLLHGDGDYLAVSSSFPLEDKKLIPSYLDFFCENGLNIGRYLSAKKIIEINGLGLKAKIFFGSAKNAASLESSTALAAHLDEAGQDEFRSQAYDAILGRLSRSGGKILISTTIYNLGWLYQRVYLPFTRGDPDYDVIQFESIMSPGFSKVQYEWLKSKLPSWQFDREYRGLFSRPTGMIYSDFDEVKHVIKPFTVPPHWNYHVGIDPGAVHTALVWAAEDPGTKIFYITNSYLDGNKTTKEHVAKAMKFPEYSRVKRWVGGSGSEQQFRDDWRAEGIYVKEPEIRDVESGIDRVTALLKENRLFIFDTEQNEPLIEEFRTYSRELDDKNEPTDKIQNKNIFHAMDSCRYIAVGASGLFNQNRFLAMSSRSFKQSWASAGR